MTNHEWTTFVATFSATDVGLDAEAIWFIENAPRLWLTHFRFGRDAAVRAAIAVVEIVLSEWQKKRPNDKAPLRAVESARKSTSTKDEDLRKHARALAKACGQSRRRSMGYEHRIAEAARAVANAASASTDSAVFDAVAEALSKTEEHILYRFAVDGVYEKDIEVRREILRRVFEALRTCKVGG